MPFFTFHKHELKEKTYFLRKRKDEKKEERKPSRHACASFNFFSIAICSKMDSWSKLRTLRVDAIRRSNGWPSLPLASD